MATKKDKAEQTNGGTASGTPGTAGALARIGGGAAGALAPADINGWALANLSEIAGGANMAEVLAENVGGSNLSAFDFQRVRVPAGGGLAWEVTNGDTGAVESVGSFDGIVTAWNDQKAYWAQGLDAQGAVAGPPDCFSLDCVQGNGKPGILCAQCPFNQFGTAKGGQARGKACKDTRLLFVNMPGDVLPQLVIVPPTSLKGVRAYFLRLAARGVPYWRAVTTFKLTRDKNAGGIPYSKVELTCAGVLQGEHAQAVAGYAATIKMMLGKATVQVRRGDLEPGDGDAGASGVIPPGEVGRRFAGDRDYIDAGDGDDGKGGAGADEDRSAQVV